MTAGQPATRACPQCGQIDQVQKVSVIVKAGTTTGTFTGATKGNSGDINHTLAHESQTVLSKLLASPKKPSSVWALWQQVAMRAFIVALLALIVGLTAATILLSYVSDPQDPQLIIIVQALFVGFFIFAFGIIVMLSNNSRAYKKQRAKWKESYYCHRCDGFFRPDDKKINAPEHMQKWLRART